ncbi:NAD(P)/FAD-dependent oxidoreductase [Propionispira raffinosivorans]|uniref:NAD(P)/FAD-dependent oxidoreductase n=1 Tax=Propionispira raffinosivorans TaxID=86959 RepID=UPI0003770B45|nr:hypothetical protein [Propionispira raffinosivorans]
MLRIINFHVPFDDESPLTDLAAKRLQLPPQAVLEVVIVRKAVDARRYKNAPICFVYIVDVKVSVPEKKVLARLRGDKNVETAKHPAGESVEYGSQMLDCRPLVIGFGPAGMFAALTLARHGYRPLVLERGRDVDSRSRDIQHFWQSGELNESSNVQFGEGGAGTFSDGKLTTRINDRKMMDVLKMFVDAGAPEEILYLQKPHIGTDLLKTIVKNIRQEIIALGGTVKFESLVTDLGIEAEQLKYVIVNHEQKIFCNAALMGIGHSARDTYTMLHDKQVAMEAKAFAIGVRIEHPQTTIDQAQYGNDSKSPRLAAAEYAVTFQDKQTGRGAYSFCMCPGGQVVAATSEENQVVTNGMSNYQRASGIANSALLVTVTPDDFGTQVLDGITFQRKYEKLAFLCAGSDYKAPVQTVGDFLKGTKGSMDFLTRPTYRPGIKPVDLRECLPGFVTDTLQHALPYFGSKIKGFDDSGAVMTGIETRSSAPCRIIRNRDNFVSINTGGLYPMGEGAGYAGGIMSAAIDGMNAAFAFMRIYKA